jgi:hypothetical protein
MTRLGNTLYPHWNDERANWLQRILPAWDYKYPRQIAVVRTLAGAWFLILTAILLGYHRAEGWAWVLIPCAAVSFLAAWYIPRTVAAITGSGKLS